MIGWVAAPEPEDALERRLSFCTPSVELRTHHLHIVEHASPRWGGWLAFRDYLRAHPETAQLGVPPSRPEGLCIEKVAAKAGVGKATIYRRWPGKEDLLLDAIAAMKTPLPEPTGESVREDLAALVDAIGRESTDPRRARQYALLLGEGTAYPRLLERYMETVIEPRRETVRSVLRRGVATGELARRRTWRWRSTS